MGKKWKKTKAKLPENEQIIGPGVHRVFIEEAQKERLEHFEKLFSTDTDDSKKNAV